MDEMATLRAMRAEVPEPGEADLRATEARFVTASRSIGRAGSGRVRSGAADLRIGHRPVVWRAALAGGLVATIALGTVVAGNLWSGDNAGNDRGGSIAGADGAARPGLRPVSAAQVLDLAAEAAENNGDLDPRADQFIVYESVTMYVAESAGSGRYLYRTKRVLWMSADGTRNGALRVEYQQPQQYPGQPIPAEANEMVGRVETYPIEVCTNRDDADRRDYAHLRTLPTDPEKMLKYLRRGFDANGGGKRDVNLAMWTAAGDLSRESYLPAAQRAALFRALKLIPGVEFVERAEDASGRAGVAVGMVDPNIGVRNQLIFDPQTYRYLGERAFVVDAAKADAPVGSQLAGTAELSVTVADSAPAVAPGPKMGGHC